MAAGAAWLTVVIHPQHLFAYSLQRGNVTLHAREPLPPQAAVMLDEALRRVARSPLYDPGRAHDVFLCGTSGMFAFLTGGARGGGKAHFSRNVFIGPADVVRGRVFGRSGEAKPAERSLAYFVGHELTHVMTMDRVGLWHYARLAAFQVEGYADYVGFSRPVDLAAGRAALRRDEPEMDPRRSGLYRRYELLVAYLLERRTLSVDELLAQRMDQRQVEQQLAAAPDM